MSNSQAVLAELAAEINDQNSARRACEVKSLMHAFRIGQLLLEAKKVTPHGSFLDWVKANTTVTPRMCQNYMTLARNTRLHWMLEHEYEAISQMTIAQAVKLDRPPRAVQDKTRVAVAQEITARWANILEIQREYVACLAEVQETFGDDAEGFQEWLVQNTNARPAFVAEVPALLRAEYDEPAWTEAMLDNLETQLAGSAPA